MLRCSVDPTIQGEGALAGVPTYFIRTGLCDYRCAWCDSGHAVLPERVRNAPKLTQAQIFEQLTKLPEGPVWVTISGGNPAMHDLNDLVTLIKSNGVSRIAVETQGTIWNDWLSRTDLITISPKPPSSGNPTAWEVTKAFLSQDPLISPTHQKVLKVVVFDDDDYEYAKAVHLNFPDLAFYLSVGTFMGGLAGDFALPGHPPGIDDEVSILERYRWLAEKAASDPEMRYATVLPQLHALIWGHTIGH